MGVGVGGRVLAPEAGIVAVIRKKNQAESSCWGRIEVCWLDGKWNIKEMEGWDS